MPPSKKKPKQSAADKAGQFLLCASNPLRNMGAGPIPIGIASGTLLDYGGERWLLSVAHATGNMGAWMMEMGLDEQGRPLLWSIGKMNFMGKLNFTRGTSAPLDMAYARVPADLQPNYDHIDKNEQYVGRLPRIILKSDLRTMPSKRKIYGFAGNIKGKTGPPVTVNWFLTELACYVNLKFVGEDGDYYLFKLPFAHPGHDEFKGISGSPICDRQGNVVALVCGAGDEPDTIAGIKMEFFRSGLDVELHQIAMKKLGK